MLRFPSFSSVHHYMSLYVYFSRERTTVFNPKASDHSKGFSLKSFTRLRCHFNFRQNALYKRSPSPRTFEFHYNADLTPVQSAKYFRGKSSGMTFSFHFQITMSREGIEHTMTKGHERMA